MNGKRRRRCTNPFDPAVYVPLVKADNTVAIMVICALIGFLNFSALPVGLELGVECKSHGLKICHDHSIG
jgi:hypothetical protein